MTAQARSAQVRRSAAMRVIRVVGLSVLILSSAIDYRAMTRSPFNTTLYIAIAKQQLVN
jgi:hypothetical protein